MGLYIDVSLLHITLRFDQKDLLSLGISYTDDETSGILVISWYGSGLSWMMFSLNTPCWVPRFFPLMCLRFCFVFGEASPVVRQGEFLKDYIPSYSWSGEFSVEALLCELVQYAAPRTRLINNMCKI